MSSNQSLSSPSRPSTPVDSEHFSQPSCHHFSQDASCRSSVSGQGESERTGTTREDDSECKTAAESREGGEGDDGEDGEQAEEEEEEAMVFAAPPVQHHVIEGDAGMVESFNVAMVCVRVHACMCVCVRVCACCTHTEEVMPISLSNY